MKKLKLITDPEPMLRGESVEILRDAARTCTACPLYRNATQTVFGEGPDKASLMFVGEQPGSDEDLKGHPFVGPAGRLLNRALLKAQIAREEVYVTNAVKHFKFEKNGWMRLHKRPSSLEISACNFWLRYEIEAVQPKLIVCLGATATQAVLGTAMKISVERGRVIRTKDGPSVLITTHPSALLRIRKSVERRKAFEALVSELVVGKRFIEQEHNLNLMRASSHP